MKKAILTALTATMFMLFGATSANAACPCNIGYQSYQAPITTTCGCAAAPVCGSYVLRPVKTCCPACPIVDPCCAKPCPTTCCPACPVNPCNTCNTCNSCSTHRVMVSPALPVVFGPPSCGCGY